MKSVIDAVVRARRDAPTMPEFSAARSSGSNGVIEREIKEVQGQLRAMKSALDTRVGVEIRSTSNILSWMVEYASVLINRYLVEKDGKTANERLRGKKSKMLGFEFGESESARPRVVLRANSQCGLNELLGQEARSSWKTQSDAQNFRETGCNIVDY